MSALNFVGRLDRRGGAMGLNQAQEQKLVKKLFSRRDPLIAHRMFGHKPVRDVYAPPTRGVNGSCKVMSKN